MRKVILLFVVSVFVLGCSGVKEKSFEVSSVKLERQKTPLKINLEVKCPGYYVEKVSVLKQKLAFKCLDPDVSGTFKDKINNFLGDFTVTYTDEKGPDVAVVVLEPSFYSRHQGNLVIGGNYLVMVKMKCSLSFKGRTTDCSAVFWNLYKDKDLLDTASVYCSEHPVEYLFVNDVMPKAVEKTIVRIAVEVMNALGVKVPAALREQADSVASEWRKFNK